MKFNVVGMFISWMTNLGQQRTSKEPKDKRGTLERKLDELSRETQDLSNTAIGIRDRRRSSNTDGLLQLAGEDDGLDR